jgi:uncharacterized protein YqjF (DUF2071 family)
MAFLTARWSNLVLITYAVPPELLQDRLPQELELDTRAGNAFASLVGFEFLRTRVLGVPWPGYRNFPEINLRFYVRRRGTGERGVMFVREFVPQRLVAWLARRIYNEPYEAAKMVHCVRHIESEARLAADYMMHVNGRWHTISAVGQATATCPPLTSDEHFFKEQRWGFGRGRDGRCIRYEVIHPLWNCHHVEWWKVDLDWASVYGEEWRVMQDAQPCSVVLAQGSQVRVQPKRSMNPENDL